MPVGLMPEEIDDLVALTEKTQQRKSWVDLSMPLQHYEFASRIAKNKKTPMSGSYRLEWKVQKTNQQNAKHSALFAPDTTGIANVFTTASVAWTKQVSSYSYDVDEELFNQGREQIINELDTRRHQMFNDYFDLMEIAIWSSPASSAVSPAEPLGIPHWLVKNATEGFNGGDPSGWSEGAGGISVATVPRWKNYTFSYTAPTEGDLLRKVRRAMDYTKFISAHSFSELAGAKHDFCNYTVHAIIEQLEDQLRARNDNLGTDLGKYDGQVTIRSTPVRWVPALDNAEYDTYDSTSPWYGVNWGNFQYFFRKGRDMMVGKPKQAPLSDTGRNVFLDSWGNARMLNRRTGGFVGYIAS